MKVLGRCLTLGKASEKFRICADTTCYGGQSPCVGGFAALTDFRAGGTALTEHQEARRMQKMRLGERPRGEAVNHFPPGSPFQLAFPGYAVRRDCCRR